jgi:hypothetical protein
MAQHSDPLGQELNFYELHKSAWIDRYAGQFALISGEESGGFFPSYEAAFEAGLQRFGLEKPFLIKQVLERDQVFVIY